MRSLVQKLLYTSSLFSTHTPVATASCPLTGPLFPRPSHLSQSSYIQDAGRSLSDILDRVVVGELKGGFDANNVSFSIGLVSLESPLPFWEYHHTAPTNVEGTLKPNGDSGYMIGSISKLFTDLLLLKLGMNLNDPITNYLPELQGESPTDWEHITLGSLANHLAGIGPNYGFPEIYDLIPLFESVGFPPLQPSDFPPCGVLSLNSGCTQQQLLSGLRSKPPVSAPNSRPIYSSISFTLLSYAMQRHTNLSYEELLVREIVTPLNLTSTGSTPTNSSSNAVIPAVQPNSWGTDYGDNAAGGGLRSSTNDLLRLAHSILSRTVLASSAAVDAWLQPTGMTADPNYLVGSPWELLRSRSLTPAHPHTINLHTKDGGALAYIARIALLDQYGVGMVLLTAGATSLQSFNPLAEAVLAAFVPAVEEAAREEAGRYVGTYSAAGGGNGQAQAMNATGNGTGVAASMEVVIDDGQGLLLQSLQRNGSDMLEAIRTVWTTQFVNPGELISDLRLYPMGIERESSMLLGGRNVSVVEEDWRLLLEPVLPESGTDLPSSDPGVWANLCGSWQSVDTIYYGGQAVDRFIFVKEVGRERILAVRSPALRLEMVRD